MSVSFIIERFRHHIDESFEKLEHLLELIQLKKQQQRIEQANQGAIWRLFFKQEE